MWTRLTANGRGPFEMDLFEMELGCMWPAGSNGEPPADLEMGDDGIADGSP